MDDNTRRRIERGARLLDHYGPGNWRFRIDPDTLDLGHECDCVLGQLYGSYVTGADVLLGDSRMSAWAFAFDLTRCGNDDDYEALTDAWHEYLDPIGARS